MNRSSIASTSKGCDNGPLPKFLQVPQPGTSWKSTKIGLPVSADLAFASSKSRPQFTWPSSSAWLTRGRTDDGAFVAASDPGCSTGWYCDAHDAKKMIAIAKPRILFIVFPLMVLQTHNCSAQWRPSPWESRLHA